jgi:predicted GNAT family acetyltransferase
LLREGKTPCLFAKSPAALAMYLKLGFVCTGTYATWRPEE